MRCYNTIALVAAATTTLAVSPAEAGFWDWISNNPVARWVENMVADEVNALIPAPILEALKMLVHTDQMSPDCRNVIQQCLDPSFPGNCKEDLMDCAYEALFGDEVSPTYADLGSDINLKEMLNGMANELGMSSDRYVGKKVMKQCLSYVDSSWMTIWEGWSDGKVPNVTNPQNDFICRALLNKSSPGPFPNSMQAPSDCPGLKQALNECKATFKPPSLDVAFNAYYPVIKKSNANAAKKSGDVKATKDSKKKGSNVKVPVTFKDCWASGDRTECVAAVVLGTVCQNACPLADCVDAKLLKSDKNCASTLTANQQRFYQAASKQCLDLADALQVDGVELCRTPELPSDNDDGNRHAAGTSAALSTRSSSVMAITLTTLAVAATASL